jgi:phage tail-like protein
LPKTAIAPWVLPTISFEVKLPTAVKIGYFTEVSGLSAEVEFQTYNEGGNNEFVHHLPTRVKYPNLVLKRGITNEDALLQWFKKTHVGADRQQVSVTLLSADGKSVRTWSFANAFPIKWTGPSFNAGQSQVATETLEIVHDGLMAL